MDRNADETRNPRRRAAPKPLSAARLEEMALAYVARFATSAGKLEAYLARKLRERGFEGEEHEGRALCAALVERFERAGYIDDAGYARMKSDSLQRRGMGRRRIAEALGQAGIDADTAAEAMPGEAEARASVLACARRRRLGPFAREVVADRAAREKQVAALLRAGHSMTHARQVLDLPDPEAAEEWLAEASGEE